MGGGTDGKFSHKQYEFRWQMNLEIIAATHVMDIEIYSN
jgi:hypothetical protein